MDDDEGCATCRFWVEQVSDNGPDDEIGICVRHSPMAAAAKKTAIGSNAEWPITACFNWCGDFEEAAHD